MLNHERNIRRAKLMLNVSDESDDPEDAVTEHVQPIIENTTIRI